MISLSVRRLEPVGAEGPLGSVATGNMQMVPLTVNFAQVQTDCTFAQEQTGSTLSENFASLPYAPLLTSRAHCMACQYASATSDSTSFNERARVAACSHSPDS